MSMAGLQHHSLLPGGGGSQPGVLMGCLVACERSGESAAICNLAPCLLPPLHTISTVCVNGPRYWARKLRVSTDPKHAAAVRLRVLWVKRKTGHLTYSLDPQGLSSIFCRQLPSVTLRGFLLQQSGSFLDDTVIRPPVERTHQVKAFLLQPLLVAFSSALCHGVPSPTPPVNTAADPVEEHTLSAASEHRCFCEAVLYECLAGEKTEIMLSYVTPAPIIPIAKVATMQRGLGGF